MLMFGPIYMLLVSPESLLQTWGQIQKYLYLKVLNYFNKYLYLYLNFLKWKTFVFVIKYFHNVYEISNTFQIIF